MRQMLKEFEEKPTDEPGEDRLSLHGLSRKERRKEKRARYKEITSTMNRRQKISYFFFCYKWHIIIPLVVLLLAARISVTIYKNTRPTSIAYAVINAPDKDALNLDVISEYTKAIGKSKGYQVRKKLGVHLDPVNYQEEYNNDPNGSDYESFPMECFNGYYDIALSDMPGVVYCSGMEIFYPVETVLTRETFSAVSDDLVFMENEKGEKVGFALDISDTSFAKRFGFGSELYLGFPGIQTKNITSAERFVRYIYGLDQ